MANVNESETDLTDSGVLSREEARLEGIGTVAAPSWVGIRAVLGEMNAMVSAEFDWKRA